MSSLFDSPKDEPRGWTDLDELRRRMGLLERRIAAREATLSEWCDLIDLGRLIREREREAAEKWNTHFKS